MKHLANVLSLLRIAGAALLLLTATLSVPFFVLYTLCGVSDLLDGYLARRTGSASSAGACLDSVADAVFFGVTAVLFIPIIQWEGWLVCSVAGIVLLRAAALAVGMAKYHILLLLHTALNKLAGLCLFFFPLCYAVFGITAAFPLCAVAGLAALEELFTLAYMKAPACDACGLFAGALRKLLMR